MSSALGYTASYNDATTVTQGGPLSPTILNVVIDEVLLHWVTVVASLQEAVYPSAEDIEVFGRDVQLLTGYV